MRFFIVSFIISLFSLLPTLSLACTNCNRLGVQGAIATGGSLGIGIVDFTETSEIGLTASGNYNNATCQTKTITPVFFGGLRRSLCQCTYLAYGLEFVTTMGRDRGCHIDANYNVGPYISIEQMLTHHVILAGWIQPYQYQYQRLCGNSLSTNHFFSTGGIGINYLF